MRVSEKLSGSKVWKAALKPILMHSKLSGRGMRQGKAQHGRQSNCKIIHLARGRRGLVFGVFHQCHIDTQTHRHTHWHTHTHTHRQAADNNKASGKRRRNYKERMFRLISKHSKAEKIGKGREKESKAEEKVRKEMNELQMVKGVASRKWHKT